MDTGLRSLDTFGPFIKSLGQISHLLRIQNTRQDPGDIDRFINLIQLPPLETIDRPYQKDEIQLENVLCSCILDMIAAVKKSPDFDDPEAEKIASDYTWPRDFERTLSVYQDALSRQPRFDLPS